MSHPLLTHESPVGLISGENPCHTAVTGGHEALRRDLDRMGAQFEETWGKYGGATERSFIVYGLPLKHLLALGKKYGQEAVIHGEGGRHMFLYTNGPKAGSMHLGLSTYEHWPEGTEPPADDYTRLPGAGAIRLHFDWGQGSDQGLDHQTQGVGP